MSEIAERAARVIHDGFVSYRERFRDVTRRARGHFERRDWHAAQSDSVRRLDLYADAVREALSALAPLLGDKIDSRSPWVPVREAYSSLVRRRPDAELAETFFNSLTRRVFHTVGVDPALEFVAASRPDPGASQPRDLTWAFVREGSLDALLRRILLQYRFHVDYDDLDRDLVLIRRAVVARFGDPGLDSVELVRSVFFRNKGAYLVGRARTHEGETPFLLALANPAGRITVDAVLFAEDEVSIVFSFARAYFFVELDRPGALVAFLRTIMPRKPVAELYNAVGCDKHGKTELYRSLLHHLERTDDRFEIAPGQRGMVMCVFTLPGFDVVFKVIRDHFDYPKSVTHEQVRERYRLVFRIDRAGRLVDAQEFEHLEFDRHRFDPRLLEELTSLAPGTVRVAYDRVVVRHLYTERRLVPLDVYLATAAPEAARSAVVDYGQVLKDLAATNVFPGDMLLKNFGVSRHGRLIFYDYDELCLLTECRFRALPAPRDEHEEGASEPWFHVGEHDVFPEEFRAFLGLDGPLRLAFLEAHEELLAVEFWRLMQERHRRGEVLDIFPYPPSRRLRPS